MKRTGHGFGFGSGRSEIEDSAEKRILRERAGKNAESSLPGIGFAVIFSRYYVFKQLATGDPIGKSKKSITNCH